MLPRSEQEAAASESSQSNPTSHAVLVVPGVLDPNKPLPEVDTTILVHFPGISPRLYSEFVNTYPEGYNALKTCRPYPVCCDVWDDGGGQDWFHDSVKEGDPCSFLDMLAQVPWWFSPTPYDRVDKMDKRAAQALRRLVEVHATTRHGFDVRRLWVDLNYELGVIGSFWHTFTDVQCMEDMWTRELLQAVLVGMHTMAHFREQKKFCSRK